MDDEFVTVPPGHKVVVIYPTTQPSMGILESELLVLDFGADGDWRAMLAHVEAGLAAEQAPATVTILQRGRIEMLVAAGELDAFVHAWESARRQGWNAVWVLPNDASGNNEVVTRLKGAGFEVHGSASRGECFVEVHKPDGTIIIGMPGPAL